jgi:hypothetical protein
MWMLATGCGAGAATDETEAPECTGPTSIQLGQGETAFEALEDGGTVHVVHGPQGGFHVDVALLVEGFGATVEVTGTVTDVATGSQVGGEQATSVVVLSNYDEEACTGTAVGVRLFLDDLPSEAEQVAAACALGAGGSTEVTATVTDLGSGATETASATGNGSLEMSGTGATPCP